MSRVRSAPILIAAALAVVGLLAGLALVARAAPTPTPTPRVIIILTKPSPTPRPAVLELIGVDHALDERTLVITGWVRNAGTAPVSQIAIDASAFAAPGMLAGFGSDGIPWALAPKAQERFQIFVPLSRELARDYGVTISASMPKPAAPPLVTRRIDPRLYRGLILATVRADARFDGTVLRVEASADDLPVALVHVKVVLAVSEGKRTVLRTLALPIRPGDAVRLAFWPLSVRVISVLVTDVTLLPSWSDAGR